MTPAIIVIAKAPQPGRVKTRLCPPCTPEQAAALARAALVDTLDAVARARVGRRVIALEGEPDGWLPPGFEVIGQRGVGLGERLAGAFADVGQPAVAIGMDTPQVSPLLLGHALALLSRSGTDAVLGPALDGGYWLVGLHDPCLPAFAGVPMTSSGTGVAQEARLRTLGLALARLPLLRDVDTIEDAVAVAAGAPHLRFSDCLHALPPAVRAARAAG